MNATDVRAELKQHHNACYSWALHCCKEDMEVASDVLQTAYLKMLEKQGAFLGKSTFKTWAFIIIRNTATDAWKKQKNRGKVIGYQDNLPDNRFESDGEAALDLHLKELFFADALQQVSERQRQILELVFYHDMSLNESAKVLGISQGSVRQHYDRAKKALANWFKKKGITKM